MNSLLQTMKQEWLRAFFLAGKARQEYLLTDKTMRDREHDHWRLYYANDAQADVKQYA